MSPVKGPALFVGPTEPIGYPSKYASLAEKRGYLTDERMIAELTKDYAQQPHFAESTELYTRFPAIRSDVPGKMLRWNPRMQLVYLVRHPVDRVLSQFRFEQTKPLNAPPDRLSNYLRSNLDALLTSRYYLQLSRFLEAGFCGRQIHVIVLEELLRDPRKQWEHVCRFLDISFVEPPLFPQLNATPAPVQRHSGDGGFQRDKLAQVLWPDVVRLESFIGRPIDIWDFG